MLTFVRKRHEEGFGFAFVPREYLHREKKTWIFCVVCEFAYSFLVIFVRYETSYVGFH